MNGLDIRTWLPLLMARKRRTGGDSPWPFPPPTRPSYRFGQQQIASRERIADQADWTRREAQKLQAGLIPEAGEWRVRPPEGEDVAREAIASRERIAGMPYGEGAKGILAEQLASRERVAGMPFGEGARRIAGLPYGPGAAGMLGQELGARERIAGMPYGEAAQAMLGKKLGLQERIELLRATAAKDVAGKQFGERMALRGVDPETYRYYLQAQTGEPVARSRMAEARRQQQTQAADVILAGGKQAVESAVSFLSAADDKPTALQQLLGIDVTSPKEFETYKLNDKQRALLNVLNRVDPITMQDIFSTIPAIKEEISKAYTVRYPRKWSAVESALTGAGAGAGAATGLVAGALGGPTALVTTPAGFVGGAAAGQKLAETLGLGGEGYGPGVVRDPEAARRLERVLWVLQLAKETPSEEEGLVIPRPATSLERGAPGEDLADMIRERQGEKRAQQAEGRELWRKMWAAQDYLNEMLAGRTEYLPEEIEEGRADVEAAEREFNAWRDRAK